MALVAYLDASGNKDHRATSVAGFIATESGWLDFDREWVAALSEFGVSALHMKDFTSSQREFAGWDRDEPKRRQFVARMTGVMNAFTDESLVSVLFNDDYHRVNQVFQIRELLGGPYSVTAFVALLRASDWRNKHHAGQSLSVFVERGDNDQGELFATLKRVGYREPVIPLDKREPTGRYIYAFQAADFLAYETFKATKRQIAEGTDEVTARKTILHIRHTGGPIETWCYTDEYLLRRFAQRLRIATRAPAQMEG